ncbi:carbohydrate-binding module family 13 protein [Flagelloscypha sp. PMI_526]|nr:carbohydrate-binding module family 13 protein [Flagelloscypha sp. PMI_526]
MPRLSASIAILASALAVSAQVPSYIGDLLIEAGNDAGKCMTAASNTNGAAVTISTCTGADAQKWKFEGGSVKVFGTKCLDVPSGTNTNGQKLQIWDCTSGNTNQQWYYTPWGDNHLAWTDHGKCLDLTDGSLTDGNKVRRRSRLSFDGQSGSLEHISRKSGIALAQTPTRFGLLATCLRNSLQLAKKVNTAPTAVAQLAATLPTVRPAWINSINDFCLWGPPEVATVGDSEEKGVAYCTKSGRGTRLIPDGTLKGVHFVTTPDYVQITGVGDFTKINIPAGDDGGEYDPHCDGEFCIRACTGPNAAKNCQHIYDVMGCYWNMPANYDAGVYEQCKGNDDEPMGVYGTSTWYQGVSPTPAAHTPAPSSSCTTYTSIGQSNLRKKRETGFEKVARANAVVHARATPAPIPL